jgi:hypothetical protein
MRRPLDPSFAPVSANLAASFPAHRLEATVTWVDVTVQTARCMVLESSALTERPDAV